jgi:hypothetical protein
MSGGITFQLQEIKHWCETQKEKKEIIAWFIIANKLQWNTYRQSKELNPWVLVMESFLHCLHYIFCLPDSDVQIQNLAQ